MEQNKTKKLTNKAIAQKGMFDEEKAGAEKKRPANIPVTKAESIKRIRPDLRLFVLFVMGLFIVTIFGWGICQSVKDINTKDKIMEYRGTEGIKKVDELIIMTAKNENDAKRNQESVKTHLLETKKAFQDYLPEEAKKIEKAVSIRCGCYVIVCVTADYETAEKTINAFIQD